MLLITKKRGGSSKRTWMYTWHPIFFCKTFEVRSAPQSTAPPPRHTRASRCRRCCCPCTTSPARSGFPPTRHHATYRAIAHQIEVGAAVWAENAWGKQRGLATDILAPVRASGRVLRRRQGSEARDERTLAAAARVPPLSPRTRETPLNSFMLVFRCSPSNSMKGREGVGVPAGARCRRRDQRKPQLV